jgi:o-succinylbenzoate synthase
MNIKNAEIYHIRLPLKHHFETSFERFTKRNLVLIKATTTDGLTGFSEVPSLNTPFYNHETTETVIHILKDFIFKQIKEKDFSSPAELDNNLKKIRGHNMAKSGIDNLFYLFKSIREKKSISKIIGGTRTTIESGISIGIQDTPKELIKLIQQALDDSYKRIKLKIQPGWDIEIIKTVRNTYPKIKLMVDANSAYTLKDINIFKKLDKYNLTMIEQPLAYNDIFNHAKLQKQIKTPICLDESINSFEEAKNAIMLGSCKIINIKSPRVGGIFQSLKIHNFCKKNKIPVMCGSMVESGIGNSYLINIASLPNFSLPGDIAPSTRYFKDNIITPQIEMKNGKISVPTKSGLGFEPDEKKIKKYTIKKITVY